MSRSRRTLTTMVVVALSSWSCGSTAPIVTPEVAAILVSPATSTLAVDAQLPLQAQVRDGSGEIVPDAAITWTVENPEIVSISAAGVVKALAVGTSQVAANALGKSGLAIITVSPPANQGSANPGSADPGSADPGNTDGDGGNDGGNDGGDDGGDDDRDDGDVDGDDDRDDDSDDGDRDDNGSSGDDQGAVATVTVTAPSAKLKAGSTMQLTATAKDDRGNTVPQSFVWSSSNTDKATVSASGVVSGKRAGRVTITARTSSTGGKSGSVRIDVEKK